MKSIFITRAVTPESTLPKALAGKFDLYGLPLIDVVKIPFSYTPQTNWIFFSSKNAIRFFFEQSPVVKPGTKFGVISDSSAQVLAECGINANFIGAGVDLTKIAKNFREVLANESVLFPQAMDSLQTIQKQLAFSNTTFNLYTYKTLLKTNFEVPYTDVVIFTSPSNVRAYFSKYKLDNRQVVIAMGTSTRFILSEYGSKKVILPNEFSEAGLAEVINSSNIF